MEDSQWVESQDWSHMLQTQAAAETQLETQVYSLPEMWGARQLQTQAYSVEDLWGSISIDSPSMETQSYDADRAAANYLAEMEIAAASPVKRVRKRAKPMAKIAAKVKLQKKARAMKKRPAAESLLRRPAAAME